MLFLLMLVGLFCLQTSNGKFSYTIFYSILIHYVAVVSQRHPIPSSLPKIEHSTNPETMVEQRSYKDTQPSFLDKINPANWIKNAAEDHVQQSLYRDRVRQEALFNVLKCLVLEDGLNCKTLLDVAESLFRDENIPKYERPNYSFGAQKNKN